MKKKPEALIPSSEETIVPKMRTLSVLVNPQIVQTMVSLGNGEAAHCLEIAKELKEMKNKDYREINLPGERPIQYAKDAINEFIRQLPSPAQDFQIQVCGSNTDIVNWVFLYTLRVEGYQAKFRHDASCAGWIEPIPMMRREILDQFPDFLD